LYHVFRCSLSKRHISKGANNVDLHVGRRLAIEIIVCLPDRVFEELNFSKREQKIIGLSLYRPLTLKGVTFDAENLCKSIALATAKGNSLIHAKSPERKYLLTETGKDDRLHLVFKAIDDEILVQDNVLAFASTKRKHMEFAAKCLRGLLDYPLVKKEKAIRAVLEERNPCKRVSQAIYLRASSISAQLSDAAQKLSREHAIEVGELIPKSVSSVLGHIFLSNASSRIAISKRLQSAAAQLLAEYGFMEAFRRISCIPRRIPDCLVLAFDNLTKPEQKTVVDSWQNSKHSPLEALQAGLLLMRSESSFSDAASAVFESVMFAKAKDEWQLFGALLRWCHDSLRHIASSDRHFSDVLLASWVYAGRLHQIFVGGEDSKQLAEHFDECKPKLTELAFDEVAVFANDVCSPHRLSITCLVVYGISSALDDFNWKDCSGEFKQMFRNLCYPYNGVDPVFEPAGA